MIDLNEEIGFDEIKTVEQARKWVMYLVEDMHNFRQICDIKIPNPTETQVRAQQRALWQFLTKQGKVIGALQALLLTKKINDVAYKELKQKAINALAPTIVGSV